MTVSTKTDGGSQWSSTWGPGDCHNPTRLILKWSQNNLLNDLRKSIMDPLPHPPDYMTDTCTRIVISSRDLQHWEGKLRCQVWDKVSVRERLDTREKNLGHSHEQTLFSFQRRKDKTKIQRKTDSPQVFWNMITILNGDATIKHKQKIR